MIIINELKKLEKSENITEIRTAFFDLLGDIVADIIENKPMFSLDNFSAIFYDEYTLETNCHKDIFNKVYLEIDQPMNYKLDLKKSKKPTKKIMLPNLYTDLQTISNDIFDSFIRNTDQNNIIWQDEYSVYIKSIILNNDNQVCNYYFQIIPCLTYYNSNNVKGIIYRKNGGTEIEYPKLSIDNFIKKNKQTKNKYKELITIFKNILLKEKDITTLPQEIIEIILYNVPNEMFNSIDKQSMINIINYLRNNNVRNFKTLDEQDSAFTSIYRSLSLIYAKHIIKLIEKFLSKN